jgi:hypothetical protein
VEDIAVFSRKKVRTQEAGKLYALGIFLLSELKISKIQSVLLENQLPMRFICGLNNIYVRMICKYYTNV